MTLARSGILQERTVTLAERPVFDFAIQPRAKSNATQQNVYKGWISDALKSLDTPSGGPEFRPSEKVY